MPDYKAARGRRLEFTGDCAGKIAAGPESKPAALVALRDHRRFEASFFSFFTSFFSFGVLVATFFSVFLASWALLMIDSFCWGFLVYDAAQRLAEMGRSQNTSTPCDQRRIAAGGCPDLNARMLLTARMPVAAWALLTSQGRDLGSVNPRGPGHRALTGCGSGPIFS